jgi:Flp pilus assembly protein TadD
MTDQEHREGFARNLGLTREKAEAYYRRALEAFDDNDLENAVLDISEAIYYDRGYADFYATRGLFYIQDLKFAEAETDLLYAVRLNRRQWLAHYCLGILNFQDGEFPAALTRFDLAAQYAPKRVEVWFYRAVAAWYARQDELAKTHMETALSLMTNDDKRRKDAQTWLKEFGVKVSGSDDKEAKEQKALKDKKKTGETKKLPAASKK